MRECSFAMIGVGNIGRRFLEIMSEKEQTLAERFGLRLHLVAVADSAGAALCEAGLSAERIIALKKGGASVAGYPDCGRRGMGAAEALERSGADMLVELSPTNLQHGEPGLASIVWALEHRMDVVTANKGPLVLEYQRLAHIAVQNGRSLLFSGAVAGGLPTVNIGRRDLVGAHVQRVEGVFNTTTNYILTRMADDGLSFGEALSEAQACGVAEANPSLDIDGWDAANKLVILANSVLGMPARLGDVTVHGIRDVQLEDLIRAKQQGNAIKLLVSAVSEGSSYRLSVGPTELPGHHPLARLTRWQMAVVYHTDIMGTIAAIIDDEGTTATAGAVLRDVINTLNRRDETRVKRGVA